MADDELTRIQIGCGIEAAYLLVEACGGDAAKALSVLEAAVGLKCGRENLKALLNTCPGNRIIFHT